VLGEGEVLNYGTALALEMILGDWSRRTQDANGWKRPVGLFNQIILNAVRL
jgi:hypothetical protein